MTEALLPDGSAKSDAKIEAVNCVELTDSVTRLTLFQYTVAPLTKLLPLIVKVKATPPRTTWLGLRELIDGSGFCTTTGILFEVPPPGLGVDTVIGTLADGLARSDAGSVTLSCVLLTYVVERLDPFHAATELITKLLPDTVRLTGPLPTVRALGETDVTPGAAGAEIVKLVDA